LKKVLVLLSFMLMIFSCSKDEEISDPAIVAEWEALNVYEDEYTIFRFHSNHTFTMDSRRKVGLLDIYSSWEGDYTLKEDSILLNNIIDEREVSMASLTYLITFEEENLILTQVDGSGHFILRKV
jgi:hypothetical protein